MQTTIFVYGTLRKEQNNHGYLADSRYLGKGKTVEKFALFASTIPFVEKNNSVSQIIGEAYVVNDTVLRRIDSLEGHPNCYKRELVYIQLDSGEIIQAWIYFYPSPHGKLIESGDFCNYLSNNSNRQKTISVNMED